MTGLSDAFYHWLPPSDTEKAKAIKTGLVVIDTNVLLDTYRFAPQARAELFDALERLGDRLWIPHQVALEFHRNRISVIIEHGNTYRQTQEAITSIREQAIAELRPKVRDLSSRVALSDAETRRLESLVFGGLDQASSELERLKSDHGIPESATEDDPILSRLRSLLNNKVGSPLSPEDEQTARQEADRRIKAKIPPGYEDHKKKDPHGDYLLWAQTLREANARSIPLLMVTRDVKDDWFWRPSGQTVGARPELAEECLSEAGVSLVLLTTQGFLTHASRHLSASISDDTLRQVDALPPPSPPTRRHSFILSASGAPALAAKAEALLEALEEQQRKDMAELESAVTEDVMSDTLPAEFVKHIAEYSVKVQRRSQRIDEHRSAVMALESSARRGAGSRLEVPFIVVQRLLHDIEQWETVGELFG